MTAGQTRFFHDTFQLVQHLTSWISIAVKSSSDNTLLSTSPPVTCHLVGRQLIAAVNLVHFILTIQYTREKMKTSWSSSCVITLFWFQQQSLSTCSFSIIPTTRTTRTMLYSNIAANDNNGMSKTPSSLFVEGPSDDTKPDYENIHGPLGKTMDTVFMKLFRSKMAEKVGVDSQLPQDDYQGLMELTAAMNARYSDRQVVQKLAQDVLVSLFPSWMPPQYKILFSKPFPKFSSRMNAWATKWAGTWLMGECEINDVEVDDTGTKGENQGLLVKRCRFLEESGCASVCVNSCKIPTQNFFMENMGLPLTMTPDYETHECQFDFGVTPTPQGELEARNTPCLSRCPTSGSMRQWHDGKGNNSLKSNQNSSNEKETSATVVPDNMMITVDDSIIQCSLMEDDST